MREKGDSVIIHVPQGDPLRPVNLRTLRSELERAAADVNYSAACEVLKVQMSGRDAFVVVQDPRDPQNGIAYTFRLDGCRRSIGNPRQQDELDWVAACHDLVGRIKSVLNVIAERLERQARTARSAACSVGSSPRPEHPRQFPAPEE